MQTANPIGPHEDRPRMSSLGRELTDARKVLRLTQARTARALSDLLEKEVHPGRISEWEQGQKEPSTAELQGLVQVLQLSADGPTARQLRQQRLTPN